jgi:hypothetical protein
MAAISCPRDTRKISMPQDTITITGKLRECLLKRTRRPRLLIIVANSIPLNIEEQLDTCQGKKQTLRV